MAVGVEHLWRVVAEIDESQVAGKDEESVGAKHHKRLECDV